MSFPQSNTSFPPTNGQPFPPQHSRSSSLQSTSTDYASSPADKAAMPELVRRDLEFFMARLTRTTSNDSTASESSVSR